MQIGLSTPVGSAPIKVGKGCVAKTKRFTVRGRLRTSKVAVCTLGFSTLVPTLLVRLGGGEDFGRIGPTHGEKASEWKVTLRGDFGPDELYDEPSSLMQGKVTLLGGQGDDKLSSKYSGRAGDTLSGGDGDDTLLTDNDKADGSIDCGAGTDTLTRDALDVTSLNCETVTP
jgi:Ca2+-binding RTX toxin-like protein